MEKNAATKLNKIRATLARSFQFLAFILFYFLYYSHSPFRLKIGGQKSRPAALEQEHRSVAMMRRSRKRHSGHPSRIGIWLISGWS